MSFIATDYLPDITCWLQLYRHKKDYDWLLPQTM